MIKKILLAQVFFLISITLYAQTTLKDNFKYKVTYDLTYSLDSTHIETKKSEDMVLFLGENTSSFSSRAKLIRNEVIVEGNTGHTPKMAVTDFQYIIIKNFKQDYLAYTSQVGNDLFYYKQRLDFVDWKLYDQTKLIKGYTAQKAAMSYSGRDYIAWFTSEIPISDGPFKFNGLPGLILEIADSKNEYVFKLKSFEKLDPKIPFKIKLKQYVLTTKEKLKETAARYLKDPSTYVNDPRIQMSAEQHEGFVKMWAEISKKENNHLEKN